MAMSPSIAVFPPSSHWFFFRDAQILFRAGRNHDGYFGSEEFLVQVDSAIDIFKGLFKGNFRALFLFDNAPSHQKQAPNAILAQIMVKGVSLSMFCFILSHFHYSHFYKDAESQIYKIQHASLQIKSPEPLCPSSCTRVTQHWVLLKQFIIPS